MSILSTIKSWFGGKKAEQPRAAADILLGVADLVRDKAAINDELVEIGRIKTLSADEQSEAAKGAKEKSVITVTPEAREMITDIGMGALVTTGAIKNIETELVAKDGKTQAVSVTASALKDEEGNIHGMVIAAKDMSEIQRLQRENLKILEKAKEDAEALVKQRTAELEKTVKNLKASEQQLKAGSQQLEAGNQQLSAAQKDLQDKLLELERFNKVAVGRELKMVELKEEIAKLKGVNGTRVKPRLSSEDLAKGGG